MWLKKLITVPLTYIVSDLNGEEIAGTFYKNELPKTNQKEFRIEKVIKRKGHKVYVIKVMIYSFNSTINKKDIVIWKWFIFHLMVIVKIKIK